LKSIEELCRVSNEVRIFPLLDVDAYRSSYVEPIIDFLRARNRDVKGIKIAYEFQKGGSTMLRIC